ncbi:MAG: S8 family peptidase [Flavobacteriales bacterium]|nr:S8 family peptidase [Flavobacteriales bacterium]
MRNSLFLLLLVCFTTVYSQHAKVNFALKFELEKQNNPAVLFPLFVIGDATKISLEVIRLKGEVIRSVNNIVQVKLPVSTIEEFSKNEFVQSIPFSFSKGQTLNDTMIIHNNVVPVHDGVSPLLKQYTGKGVVFGIIDTGHDIDHPDFKDTLGSTRIYRIWDQVSGVSWDSASINNGTCTHTDYNLNGHGTQVSGIGSGNGLALGMFKGVAPEATIVVVANDDTAPNWLFTIVDAVDYIFRVADSLNMPCVINVSLGDYFGSHDGTDPAALLIDSIINYKPGRALVCAGGNAGFFNWHVEQTVTADTSFTWLKYNAVSALGFGSVFYEVWSDTVDFNNVQYAFGANLPTGTFEERGRTPFFNIKNRLGTYIDTIKNGSNILAIVETYAEIQDDKYLLQVLLNEPDSNTYNFSMLSTGTGNYDFWSHHWLGTSYIVEDSLPSIAQYPPMAFYTLPDSAKTTVSSFSCSPNLLTVANFVNRKTYLDVDTVEQVMPATAGEKAERSSLGPDRRGNIKPDIGATGDNTIGPRGAASLAALLGAGGGSLIGVGGMHARNGGTSMASPVVAGTVALYFEKCPNATMAEVKAAILGTAKQDAFTGAVPNSAFGYGKIDAFAALNNSNYSLSISPDRNVCEGDSILIFAGSYSSYLWSTNGTNNFIYADTAQQVFVTVTNTSGCKSISDTIDVIWHPLPLTTSIIVQGNNDSLYYPTNLNIQWYYNNSLIPFATDTFHHALNNGNYYVEVTDSFGCKNTSDTASIIILGIETNDDAGFSIYPNPTSGQLTIEFENDEIESIAVINLLGEIVLDKKVNGRQLKLDITNFAEGVYYIRLRSKNNKYLQKLILLR